MDEDSVRVFLNQMGTVDVPTPAQQLDLARRAQAGDTEARKRMMAANLRLVVFWASRYQNQGVDLLDLIQEGSIGLAKAIDRFDTSRGISFSTYATWWVRNALQRALTKQAAVIYIPDDMRRRCRDVDVLYESIFQQRGRQPSSDEVAKLMGISSKDVSEARQVATVTASLNAPASNGDGEIGSFIAIDPSDVMSDALLSVTSAEIRGVVARMPHPHREAVTLRFGLGGRHPMSLEAVAAEMGMSRRVTADLLAEAIRELKDNPILREAATNS